MARWVDGREPGSGFWTNTDLRACEDCGTDLGPGEARLTRCKGGCDVDEHRVPDSRGTPRGGVHVRCRDEGACRRRRTPKVASKRDRAAAIVTAAQASTSTQGGAPTIASVALDPHLSPTPPLPLGHLDGAALLCAIAELIERDGALEPEERRSTAAAVLECVVRRDGLLVDLTAAADVVRVLTPEPAWGAVRAAAAACIARDMAEYDQVEIVLTLAGVDVAHAPRPAPGDCIVVVDVETTGLDEKRHEVIDVAAVLVGPDLEVIAEAGGRTPLLRPELAAPEALAVNHYSPEGWRDARPLADVLPGVLELVHGAGGWLGSNPGFDVRFVGSACASVGLELRPPARLIDTAAEARRRGVRGQGQRPQGLDALCELFGVRDLGEAHTARADCLRALEVYRRLTTTERSAA